MEVEEGITINRAFAEKYEKKKRAEELSNCKSSIHCNGFTSIADIHRYSNSS